MKHLSLRGALLLPLFFYSFNIFGQTDILKYYEVFYTDIEKYDKWLVSDKNDFFKDIFISLYNLPDKSKRTFIYDLEIKMIKSYSKGKFYSYFYIEILSRTSVEILFYGIKKGAISINGSNKKEIRIDDETGYSHLQADFEKGIYFLSVNIEEKFDKIPVKALSNKKIRFSDKRGFTKDSSAKFTLTDKESRYKSSKYYFHSLFNNFCFPYNSEKNEKRNDFFSIIKNMDKTDFKSENLIYILYSLISRNPQNKQLLKMGFSQKQIDWWYKNFFEKEVCFDAESK